MTWVHPHFVYTRGQTCYSIETKALTAKYCRHHALNMILISFLLSTKLFVNALQFLHAYNTNF